jgi:hypothetical protein
MSLQNKYPKLFEKLEDKELELRHLLNVDENYEDYDSEEFDFNFEEYNYVLYIAEPIQKALGEEKMSELVLKLSKKREFENFGADEIDLYGVKSQLNEGQIIELILNQIEEIL